MPSSKQTHISVGRLTRAIRICNSNFINERHRRSNRAIYKLHHVSYRLYIYITNVCVLMCTTTDVRIVTDTSKAIV